MTDMDDVRSGMPPTDPLDELASALLDGEATDEERARAGEADVAARMVRFRQAAEAVRAVAPPDDARRDAAVAAALAAWEASAPSAQPVRRPTDELAVRRDRTVWWPGALRVAGVAAAVIAAFVLGGVVQDDGTRQSDETAATTAASPAGADDSASGGASEDAGVPGRTAADEGATATPASPTDAQSRLALDGTGLGTFDDIDRLVDAAAGLGQESQPPSTLPGDDPVAAAGCPLPTFDDVEAVTTAIVDGRFVVVLVGRGDDGRRRVEVLDPSTCEVLADRTP